MTPLEQNGAASKLPRGVAYDPRVKKFFARMMVRGARMHIGSFATAEEASDAYQAARVEEPITRDGRAGGPTVNEAFHTMLEDPRNRDERGFLIPGHASFGLMPGQIYTLARVDYRKAQPGAGRKRWIFWVFETECLLCGTPFEVKVRLGVKNLHGVARNCEKHRGVKGEPWSLLAEKTTKQNVAPVDELNGPERLASLRPATRAFVEKHMADHGGTVEQAVDAYADWVVANLKPKSSADDLI